MRSPLPPKHIAIIMDGNGRWAKQKKRPRIFGHRQGVKTVDRIVTYCRKTGIEYLTLYSFSAENWARPADEVSALMGILKEYLIKELGRMIKEDIRFNVIGDIEKLPDFVKEAVTDAMKRTEDKKGMTLTLALSYGSRQEILTATANLAKDVVAGTLNLTDITEKEFSSRLYSSSMPDPDLLIRTSGEYRISNFLLWQMAYTELYFTDKLWPDFNEDDMDLAIDSFHRRERRFGKTTEQMAPDKK